MKSGSDAGADQDAEGAPSDDSGVDASAESESGNETDEASNDSDNEPAAGPDEASDEAEATPGVDPEEEPDTQSEDEPDQGLNDEATTELDASEEDDDLLEKPDDASDESNQASDASPPTCDATCLADRCRDEPSDGRCGAPSCEDPAPLRAYAWQAPRHWPGRIPPQDSPIAAVVEIALHQGGDPQCDWLNDNNASDCTVSNVARNLNEVAARLAEQPAGQRALLWRAFGNETLLQSHSDDVCVDANGSPTTTPGIWWDAGVDAVQLRADAVFSGLVARNVKPNWLIMDIEWGLSVFVIGTCGGQNAASSASRWRCIQEDARFTPVADQLATDFGLTIHASNTLESNFCPISYADHDYLRWNALMRERTAQYYADALYLPASGRFPNIAASNYGYSNCSAAFEVPDLNGHRADLYGDGAIVGTHQAPFAYGQIGQLADSPNAALGNAVYARTAFNSFRLGVNQVRSRRLAAPQTPLSPWVAPYSWQGGSLVPHGNTALWDELLLHIAMTTPDVLLYWNNSAATTIADDERFEDVLVEFNRVCGCTNRKTMVADLADWWAPYVLTGLELEDRVVWRLTTMEDAASVVDIEPLTFDVGDTYLLFPDAWLLDSSYGRGRWILQGRGAGEPIEAAVP